MRAESFASAKIADAPTVSPSDAARRAATLMTAFTVVVASLSRADGEQSLNRRTPRCVASFGIGSSFSQGALMLWSAPAAFCLSGSFSSISARSFVIFLKASESR
jgi:hypothetical protein